MSVLDVFTQDAFSVLSLTDAINKQPFIPGRAGAVAGWNEQGVATTSIMLEEIEGTLQLVNPTPRGGPGSAYDKDKRAGRILAIPHYQVDDGINADEVQNVRAFGQESAVQTIQEMVNMRMGQHVQLKLDPTLEYQRIGAITGIILNGDGSTLYNLFTEFAVSAQSEVDFNLDAGSSTGAVRTKCTGVVRTIAKALGGAPYSGVYGFCSDAFWDALIANIEVRESYLAQQEASQLRAGVAYETLRFGGITFENYRGGTGTEEATAFIATDKAYFFPVGVPGLFRTVYAPADYVETVNTIGLPRYAKQYPRQDGKGIIMQAQMNALNYCTRPRALVKGKTT